MFGLRGIGYTCLGKIITVKKIVWFTSRLQLYDACKCELTQNHQKSDRTRVKQVGTSVPSECSQQARTSTLLCLPYVSFCQIIHDVIFFIFHPFHYFLLHKI